MRHYTLLVDAIICKIVSSFCCIASFVCSVCTDDESSCAGIEEGGKEDCGTKESGDTDRGSFCGKLIGYLLPTCDVVITDGDDGLKPFLTTGHDAD